ncbi:related to TRM44 - tRNA(Ser) Um(44) 2'-O-methyltransferase [Melanopsichium pennsylvanicum]|uniref:tRNA (uracil-O(2)-)-methyltransferase n=2 Tax=Melanopsichium pennsylvanicum TaxID=63383 RepID=A0AAJ5C4U5_9BASI|nr:duf1613-domain-containing protein [Melanopsichium pennsylvanicum 4]SNX84076.1 related to TRM44 - tRNA(Ser) Um(44) 2'-O-methyltransferase [Melanopsichium pennsylvanicum]
MSSSNAESSKTAPSTNSPRRMTVEHQQLPSRPKLIPVYPSSEALTPPRAPDDDKSYLPISLSGLGKDTQDGKWVSIITAPAFAPMQAWLTVMHNLIRHPERNSSNILRADIISESKFTEQNHIEGRWTKKWTIRRALLPRRPNLDWRMEQDCTLYHRRRASQGGELDQVEAHEQDDGEGDEEAVVVYTPLIGVMEHPKMVVEETERARLGKPPKCEAEVPFYHPKVRALAFHFYPSSSSASPDTDTDTIYGTLGISLIPFSLAMSSTGSIVSSGSEQKPEPGEAYPPNHRLSRVGLSLLTTLHMHTWGHLHSYKKRVHHDTVVPRELYQDLYLELKQKYAAQLIGGWVEATDAKKHVFEEMGIAAFLISLWRLLYQPNSSRSPSSSDEQVAGGVGEEGWKVKVKFVDVGCGNGLLTHILSLEGFKGVGLDLRSRKSWPGYAKKGTMLKEWCFDPSSLLLESASAATCESDLWTGAWLLGNHADELTPWLPVLATQHSAAGFINLPCCYFSLDGTKAFPLLLKRSGEVSRNEQYLAYVSELHSRYGWQVELEPLRIPSTKNWCFVGKNRIPIQGGEEALKLRVREAVQQAIASGWAARVGASYK